MTKTTDRLAEVLDAKERAETVQSLRNHADERSRKGWLTSANNLAAASDIIERDGIAIQSLSTDLDKAQRQLKTVLDREAETHSRHDAKMDALEERIAELEGENARLRLDVDMHECLQDGAYKAGLHTGRNFGEAGDEEGYQRAMQSTEHIAELRRIREARAA